jgi:excisionase family DNA binding protein
MLVGAHISGDHDGMAIWLDFKELTSYLKMPRSTLYRLVQSKQLPGHKVGRSWRFDRDEIDRWIKGDGRTQIRGAK